MHSELLDLHLFHASRKHDTLESVDRPSIAAGTTINVIANRLFEPSASNPVRIAKHHETGGAAFYPKSTSGK